MDLLNTCTRSCSVRPARFATSRSCRRRGGCFSPGASVRSDAPTAPRTSAGWRARRRNAKSKIARGVAPGPMELLALQCEAARSPSGARRNGRHGATVGRWNARKSAQFSRGGLRGYAWVGQRRRNVRTKLKRGLSRGRGTGGARRRRSTVNEAHRKSCFHTTSGFDRFAAPSE